MTFCCVFQTRCSGVSQVLRSMTWHSDRSKYGWKKKTSLLLDRIFRRRTTRTKVGNGEQMCGMVSERLTSIHPMVVRWRACATGVWTFLWSYSTVTSIGFWWCGSSLLSVPGFVPVGILVGDVFFWGGRLNQGWEEKTPRSMEFKRVAFTSGSCRVFKVQTGRRPMLQEHRGGQRQRLGTERIYPIRNTHLDIRTS